MRKTIDSLLAEIRSDNRSGASELAGKAVECLFAFLDSFQGKTHQDFVRALCVVGQDITEAQPAMAPLFNLVNRVLLRAEETEDLTGYKEVVRKEVRDFKRTLERGWEVMVDSTWPLLRDGSSILVHSYSATLCRVLVALHNRRKVFSVTCTESRPLLEGITLARRLVGNGISVRLIVDSAAFQLLDEMHLMLVGADTISPFGVTNKIGTRGLAMAAQCQDIPFYVLAGTDKCLPMDVQVHLEEETRSPEEILQSGEPIEVFNFYFDRTPLAWVSGVITERGLWTMGQLQKYLKNLKIHPVLTGLQKEHQ